MGKAMLGRPIEAFYEHGLDEILSCTLRWFAVRLYLRYSRQRLVRSRCWSLVETSSFRGHRRQSARIQWSPVFGKDCWTRQNALNRETLRLHWAWGFESENAC